MNAKIAWRRFRDAYVRFTEGPGFALIAVLCVMAVTGAAVYGRREAPDAVSPTAVPMDASMAARLLQQTLPPRATAAPTPTATPAPLSAMTPPLDAVVVLRPFCESSLVHSGMTGIWTTHPGVDLAATRGEKVKAMTGGVVADCGSDRLSGAWVLMTHGDYQALYAGMALLDDLRPGDRIDAGQTLGFAGSGPLDEQDLPGHLHLEVTLDGKPVDPLSLW